jgi:hypothetical protein
LIGVNVVGHEPKQLNEVMAKENVTWRSLSGRAVSAKWNAATPTYYVIDHRGVIRNKWVGSPGEGTMDTALEKLIKEAEADEKKLVK